jgi:SPP1 family predicted phage head-tail adaptor
MRYEAHDYQKYATDFILTHPVAAVFLEMGLGKSVITLTALFDLILDQFLIRKVLVIAPLRVARDTWPSEIKKWDHLAGLTYSVVVGSEAERRAALARTADVYIINRENVDWLITKSKIPFDFDMIVIDELSSFKSYQAKRFKSLLKARPVVKRIVGLTGTPSSNGLMDLWAEFRVLDLGQRLGRYITHYRNAFFRPDKRNGEVIYAWTNYYTCFATIGGEGLASSKEEQVAGTTVEEASMTVTVRYCQKSAAITSTGFRVVFMGELYNIENIDHMNFRKRSLKFTCRKERR